ncbi:FecCD family ABC transporter permease [Paractinoplanes lichenicola]|uniref:Iron chelate uptake ABC transporter family permease subunit n=1 Tax=Paractinoplanes lichenicola TaxID=2802976 RepID=A0ABS1VW71_9ACTN|nr:iron ABC transporter permease [Actinoplanes lichenicola]MBL7258735.1 iron chelate uptake ABC transporter family permease subunit [Actinoplanes lichenicola]
MRPLVLLGLGAATALSVVLSLAIGAQWLHPGGVWQAVIDPDPTAQATAIVRELRLPRTVLGLLIGLALGAAGALMQGHTRNPLADPGLLGISAGASFAVVIGIQLGAGGLTGYIWFAFAGALAASVAVFGIAAGRRGGPTPVTLALAGMAISALLGSFTQSILLADQASLNVFRFWIVGSLSGRDAEVAAQVAPFIAAGLLLALANAPALNALGLGEDVARALGQRVFAARAVGVAAIVLLAGAATAACGPIGFLGLMVPHIARSLVGPDHRWLIPASALAGATLLLLADVLGRIVVSPGELQTGIVLAAAGAPFFIYLVRSRRGVVKL